VLRAISILKAFDADTPEMGIGELSRRVRLNRSTVHRLVGALISEGLMAQDVQTGKYRLGPELVALGALVLRNTDLRRVALPHLQALARQTGETVDLEILSGSEVVVIEEVPGEHVLSAGRYFGQRYPAHCTSTGKVLLAHLPPVQLQRILDSELVSATPRSVNRPDDLVRELARVREQGFALSAEELEEDLIAVGAPIFDGRGTAVASLSVSGPRRRITSRRIPELVQAVRATAAEISRQLGRRSDE
jgi:DNA-binding IclR family transcriptional regulator